MTNSQLVSVEASETQTPAFLLSNGCMSYGFRVSPEGILEHLYYGASIPDLGSLSKLPKRVHKVLGLSHQDAKDYSLNNTAVEFPVFGTSDFRYPAFHGLNSDGNSVFNFVYKSHEITSQKPSLHGLPSARGGASVGDSQTLIVTLVDDVYNVEIELYYTIYKDYNVLCRAHKVTNKGAKLITLQSVFSMALDLSEQDYEVLHLKGTWSAELAEERLEIPSGRFVIESARGTSSAAHNPFVALLEKGTTEQSGQVYAAALCYSGNFAITIEKNEMEKTRVMAGINPFNFSWKLKSEESFTAPECVQVYSANGLDGMSQQWHKFVQNQVSPEKFAHKPRPTYLNTWEAAYFDISEEKVIDLADRAKQLGVEMLVVDDGWFEGRRDDTTSLGDWTPDKERFPNGIISVAQKVKAKDLLFGLWLEPEMINFESNLYRAHPDWALQVPHRKLSSGRQQYILDLSNPDVTDYLFEIIDGLLASGSIDYIKWDMNRYMSEVGSLARGAERQQETGHRYILGLYDLVSRITSKYPNVLFENCASGGNRFDLGMLSYMSQGWVSDMCDPIARISIVNGASYLYPPSVLASYIGPSPNHQNGRVSSFETRAHAAFFCGARGLSLNEEALEQDDEKLRQFIQHCKDTNRDIINSQFHRVFRSQNDVCWQVTADAGKHIYIGYFNILSEPNVPFRHARLVGLEPEATYQLRGSQSQKFSGAALMHSGLDLPVVDAMQFSPAVNYMPAGDFSSVLMTLDKLQGGSVSK